MAAYFSTGLFVGKDAWHGLGTTLPADDPAAEIINEQLTRRLKRRVGNDEFKWECKRIRYNPSHESLPCYVKAMEHARCPDDHCLYAMIHLSDGAIRVRCDCTRTTVNRGLIGHMPYETIKTLRDIVVQ